MLSGATPVAFFGLANWITHIRGGTVKAIAVDGDARSPLLPEVPTLRELGYRGRLTRVYFGIVAPSGTPPAIIARLRDELTRIGGEAAFRQKRLIDVGLEPVFDTPEAFAAFLKQDRAGLRAYRQGGRIGAAVGVPDVVMAGLVPAISFRWAVHG